MQQSHKLIFNALTSYGAAFVQGLVGFLLVPLLLNKLGKEAYGVILLCFSTQSMTELLGMTLGKAVTKYISEYRAKKDSEQICQFFNSAIVWFLMIGILSGTIVAFLGIYFDEIFSDISPSLARDAKYSMLFIAFSSAICLMMDIFRGILWAEQRYDIVNISASTRSIGYAVVAALYVYYISPSILAVVIIMGSFRILMRISFARQAFKLVPELKLSLSKLSKKHFLIITNYAAMTAVVTVANLIGYEFVKFIVGIELTFEDVTNYGIVIFMVMFAYFLIQNISHIMVPAASRYQGLNDTENVKRLFLTGTKYVNFIGLGMFIAIAPILDNFIVLWVGAEYKSLTPMIILLGLSQVLVGAASCSQQTLSGLGKVKFIAAVSIIWAISGVTTGWLYLKFVPGATLANFVLIIALARVLGGAAIIGYGLKCMNVKILKYFKTYYSPIVFSLLICIFSYFIDRQFQINSWIKFILWLVFFETTYLLIVFLGGLETWEKVLFISFFKKMLLKLQITKTCD